MGNEFENATDRKLSLMYDEFDSRLFEFRTPHTPIAQTRAAISQFANEIRCVTITRGVSDDQQDGLH